MILPLVSSVGCLLGEAFLGLDPRLWLPRRLALRLAPGDPWAACRRLASSAMTACCSAFWRAWETSSSSRAVTLRPGL